MQIKKYNIAKPEKYMPRNGPEKTAWHTVGTLTEFTKDDGSVSRIVEIPAINLKANVFEFKERAEAPQRPAHASQEAQFQEEIITPDDIPF